MVTGWWEWCGSAGSRVSKWSDSGVLKVCPAGFFLGLVTWYDIKVWGLKWGKLWRRRLGNKEWKVEFSFGPKFEMPIRCLREDVWRKQMVLMVLDEITKG